MKFYFAFILLVCVYVMVCSDASEQTITEHENNSESENEGEPFDHSAFLEIDDTADMHIQNSKESKLKMRKLIREIDIDKDGKLSEKELGDWIRDVMNNYIVSEGEKQMPKIDKDDDKHVTWEEYKSAAGYSDQVEPRKSSEESKKLDKQKFDLADSEHDGKLSSYELGVMIHPNESPDMTPVVVSEFIVGMDQDKDGKVSAQEFSGFADNVPSEIDGSFGKLDSDKDGFLDSVELRAWLAPKDKHPFQFEVENLTQEIDDNKDGFLTEKEIFRHYAVFATSRATKYGRLLKPGSKKKKSKEKETSRKQNDETRRKQNDEL